MGCWWTDLQLISKSKNDFDFCYMSPIFLVDMHVLLLPKAEKVWQLLTNSKFLEEPNRKLNKILVDKGSEVCNWSMKSWLLNNDIEMYSAHNEKKFVVAERFIRSLKTKFTNMWLQYPETCTLIK